MKVSRWSQKKKKLKRKSPKNGDQNDCLENNASGKKAAVSELQPVVVQSESAKKCPPITPFLLTTHCAKQLVHMNFANQYNITLW